MRKVNWKKAIVEWRAILGDDYVLVGRGDLEKYENNVSGYARSIPVVLCPSTTDETQSVVRIANRYKTPLYPISTGKNWGFGSRIPSCEDCAVVDLGRMNRIIEVNVEQSYAVIEPGVTQKQLYEYLVEHQLPLLLNVTGSAAETSIIGNALERGIGYFNSRAESLSGMEVVLGTGEIIRTGFGHFENSTSTYVYRHGVGPALDGIFSQSNFGIVTSAGIDLMPVPETQAVMVVQVSSEDKLGDLVEAFSGLLRSGAIDSVIHIGNLPRARIAMCPCIYDYLQAKGLSEEEASSAAERYLEEEGFGPWSAVAGLMGSRARVSLAKREIRSALRGIGRVMFLSERLLKFGNQALSFLGFIPSMRRKQAILATVAAQHDFSICVPTSISMQSVCWPVEKRTYAWPYEPDQTRSGMLYVVPFCPLRRKDVDDMVRYATEICSAFKFEPYITLNTVNDRCLEAVINIAFDRAVEEDVQRAQDCIGRMLAKYVEVGMIPYRVGVGDMGHIVKEGDTFWRTVRDIKGALDPNGIISPGRYNLV